MSEQAEYDGSVAIVTGGGSGLGRAIAAELDRRGAQVFSLDIDSPQGDCQWETVKCDVGDPEQVDLAVRAVLATSGKLDILIANAGIGAQGSLEESSDEQWRRVFEVNVFGAMRVIRAALPSLRSSANGAIVLTSSIAAWTGIPDRSLYSASKGALNALTLALAADLLGSGIRVNAVAPGTADTPWVSRLLAAAEDPDSERAALQRRQPTGRLVRPEEVADAVAYLASPRSGSTTGVILPIDGGMHTLRTRQPS